MHKITTIICNYNHEQYLAKAIESIANQTHRNMDVIVVDDGSTNDPIDIIKDSNWNGLEVKYVKNEKNQGKWSCLNNAIGMSNSRWFMIQDADDYAFPWKAESQLSCLLETNTSLNLAGYIPINIQAEHDADFIESMKSQSITGQLVNDCAMMSLRNSAINHNYTGQYDVHNGASMFSRSFHEIGFRFQPAGLGLRITKSEDSDYNLRATLQFGRTSWLPKVCYSYKLGSGHPEGSF